jgi:hypothetical protein
MTPHRHAPPLAALAALALLAAATPAAAQMVAGPRDQKDMTLDARARAAVLDSLVVHLRGDYVFPDVAKVLERELRARQKRGDFDADTSAKQFVDTLSSILLTTGKDRHFRVFYRDEPIPARSAEGPPPATELARMREMERRTNYGIERAQRLAGNVGLLEVRSFAARGAEAGEAMAAAMRLLEHTDALIVDVRRNGGGDPAWVQTLSTWLFPAGEPTHLNDLVMRRGGVEEVVEFYTLPWVPGTRVPDKPVYVLTSRATGSGAEEFTYNLRCLKRATIVGDTTWGGANPGSVVRLGEHFAAFIPNGRARNPITKTNWEGVGVRPDVPVPPGEALRAAHVMALEKLIAECKDDDRRRWLERGLEAAKAASAEPWEDPRARRGL